MKCYTYIIEYDMELQENIYSVIYNDQEFGIFETLEDAMVFVKDE